MDTETINFFVGIGFGWMIVGAIWLIIDMCKKLKREK